MASRKSRKVNKRFSKVNKEWPEKDATNANKSSTRKKKLLDLLGSQWSKEELERFYESYRKYGKDWKKVAGTLRNRSIEMVEALYNMNRAYLSLPEGTATAAGLIAMMTDHYNNLEGSDSERESNDVPRTSRKAQKRGRGKIRLAPKGTDGNDPDLLQNQSSPSSYGGLSLLKRNLSRDLFAGRGPRAVGRRTPRIPVSNMSGRDKTISPIKQGLKFPANAVDDEGAHVAAWALAEAFQRGGSPLVSRTPDRKGKSLETTISKLIDVRIDDDCLEGSLESREAENGDVARDVESAGAFESHRRMKKGRGKRPKPGGIENDHFDDDRGECSGTDEGITRRKIKDEIDVEVTDAKAVRTYKGSRKRSRQLFFGDESSALDALQTLADLSVNILLPASTIESESSVHVKEGQKNAGTDEKPGIPESMSTNHPRDKSVIFEKKDRGGHTTIIGTEVVTRRNTKPAKVLPHDKNASSEIKSQTCKSIPKVQKRKQKLLNEKTPKAEYSNDAQNSEFQKTQVSVEDSKGFISKVKNRSQVTQLPKQGKLIKPPERPSDTDLGNTRTDLTEAIVQRSTEDQVVPPTKICNRRKMDLQKALSSKDLKTNHGAGLCSFINKDKLCHCLSSPMLRRWCVFEWFYSAIDYPWFARSEFVEYLNHVRLGHVPRLTRVEWGVIRSSLGKPRRFSEKFLQEEREKLEQYRELVRTHYAELRAGVREGLPTDLARPLSVGQRVIACHAKTREVHDGSVLAVDRNRCRVQFDRPELGVEFVMDIDCMPLNPLENMPEALRRQNDAFNKFCIGFTETKLDHQPKEWNIGVSLKFAPSENFNIADGISHIALSSPMNTLMKQAKGDTIDAIMQAKAAINEVAVATQQAMYTQPCTLAQIQAREVDIRALAELARALDKKEALLIELRHMNEEVSETQEGDPVKDLEHFRKQYAMLLLQLRDANDQVASALHYLRQRNTYHGNSTSTLLRPFDNSGGTPGPLNSSNPTVFLNKDYGSHIVEVIDSSRRKARTLVDTAVKAMCNLKQSDDVFVKIGEALDSANVWNSLSGHGSSAFQDHTTSRRFEPTTVNALSPKPHISCDVNEVQLPLELISSCVATLYMIESCSERQYPPAEVAQILDSAVASLQPCCPQNLPIYREIESCMGIIKNQMLALIPTPTTVLPAEAHIL